MHFHHIMQLKYDFENIYYEIFILIFRNIHNESLSLM